MNDRFVITTRKSSGLSRRNCHCNTNCRAVTREIGFEKSSVRPKIWPIREKLIPFCRSSQARRARSRRHVSRFTSIFISTSMLPPVNCIHHNAHIKKPDLRLIRLNVKETFLRAANGAQAAKSEAPQEDGTKRLRFQRIATRVRFLYPHAAWMRKQLFLNIIFPNRNKILP